MKKIIISVIAFLCVVSVANAITVKEGDTLSKLAVSEGVSLSELITANPHITNPNLIYPGDEINLQGSTDINLGATIPTVIGFFETSLASKITSSATTMTLVTGTDDDGTTLSGIFGFVIDEGTSSEEVVVATCAGTACTSMRRGISVLDGWTEVTASKKTHRRGSSVKMTNFPQLAILSRILNGTERLPNLIGYASNLTVASTTDLVTKIYVDNGFNQGAATSTESVAGISELATRIENASSTPWGATEPHVQQSEHATSTPSANIADDGLWDVWTENDGKLAQGFIDLTDDYTWTGDQSFTNTSTTNATTTRLVVGTNPTTDDELFVTGDSYFSGNATTTGTHYIGTGDIQGTTASSTVSRWEYTDLTSQTVANTTDETTLYSFTLPGGTLGDNGAVRMNMFISNFNYEGDSSGGSGITFNLKYDDTTVATAANTDFSDGALTGLFGKFEGFITASSSPVLQKGFLNMGVDKIGANQTNNRLALYGGSTGAEDSTGDLTVTVSVDWGAADANSSITTTGFIAEIIK